jgi:hypothetical protein
MKLLYFIFIVSIYNFCEVVKVGDPCEKSYAKHGIVTKFDNCREQIINLVKNNSTTSKNSIVGKEKKIPLVCCPTRKAVYHCKSFGERPKENGTIVYRILYGQDADVGELPYFASLAYINQETNGLSFDCGGCLISGKIPCKILYKKDLIEAKIFIFYRRK